ncbi:hypothetical protein, partial [Enterococcus sp. S86.2]|uniref:hypothetical protein n=1 Tax=Enterococcus sp. S86.2 TaxID=3031299 RepID=UPI0026EE2AE7
TASSKQEAIQKIVAKTISKEDLRNNYQKAFEYCEKIKINPCNEINDDFEEGDSFSFGVKNDWNTVDIYNNGKFGYSLNDGEEYKDKLTFEQLKKVLDKYAADNK